MPCKLQIVSGTFLIGCVWQSLSFISSYGKRKNCAIRACHNSDADRSGELREPEMRVHCTNKGHFCPCLPGHRWTHITIGIMLREVQRLGCEVWTPWHQMSVKISLLAMYLVHHSSGCELTGDTVHFGKGAWGDAKNASVMWVVREFIRMGSE